MKTKCNHTIGAWSAADENGLVSFSDWHSHHDIDVERFKFCPECGKNIEGLTKPRKRVKRPKLSPLEKEFEKASSTMFLEQMAKHCKKPSLSSVLKQLQEGAVFPEGMGDAVKAITFERSFTTE